MTALNTALGYAEKGWRVFPLKPDEKTPLTQHGCLDATTSSDVIKLWWLKWPSANIGIATGKASNLVAFDFDVKDGHQGQQTYMDLLDKCGTTETLMSITPSGGWHVFFQNPDITVGNRTDMLPGLDIRGEGGYVVAPGSSIKGDAYAWKTRLPPIPMPDAWKQLLVNGKEREKSEPFDRQSVLDGVEEGKRDDTLYRYVCSLQAKGSTEAEAEILVREAANRCEPKFDIDIAMKKVKRVYSQYGQAEDREETDEPDEPLPFFKISADFDPTKIPRRDWLIPGFLLRGYITATLAPGGVGKSVFWLTTAVALASGIDILGQGITNRQRVCVINNEDDSDELKRRVAAICLHHKIPFADIEENLFLLSGYGHSLTISKEIDGVVVPTANKKKLKSFLVEKKIDAVFIDPFISTHESEENNNTQIDKVMGIYKEIMRDTQTAFGASHHTRKGNAGSEAFAGDVESGRGAKAMTDAARVAVTMCRMCKDTAKSWGLEWEQGRRLVRIDDGKSNYDLSDECAKWIRLASHPLPNGDWVGVPEAFDAEPYIRSEKDEGKKWTATTVAEAIEPICSDQPDPNEIELSFVLGLIMQRLDVKRQRATTLITLLSQKEKSATRISVDGCLIEYWISKRIGKDGKQQKTSPWVIHRMELS